MYEVRATCRSCESKNLTPVLSLGEMPLADALVDPQREQKETRYPLNVAFCRDCWLMQIKETVDPEILFCRDYPYYSSFSEALLQHSRDNALGLIRSQGLSSKSLVIELASNDGYLLKNFKEQGIPVLGIDPAEGPAMEAVRSGIPTLTEFFDTDLARRLNDEGRHADVIIANNVLAHVADLNGFVEGIRILLKDNGVAVIECPYVKDLIENCEFDTIYHEHLCYFSVSALAALFRRHGLMLNHIDHLAIHGGSLRLFVGKSADPDESVKAYLQDEAAAGLTEDTYFRDFGSRVNGIKEQLVSMVIRLKGEGRRIAGYGAAAKGATLINFTGLDSSDIDFVADLNVHKQGLRMPGVGIPIRHPKAILDELPDYVLILAWNFKDEIMRQQNEYTLRGGKWIVPIPVPSVVEHQEVA